MAPLLVIRVRTGREAVAREACAAGARFVAGGPWSDVAVSFGVGSVGSLDVVTRAVATGVAAVRAPGVEP